MITQARKYLFLVFIILIAACIETDIYLPAFPDMMVFFAVSEETIQSILTWNFIGICLSGPFYGPLSDIVGRKKPLMIALGLFLLGSIITLFSTNFTPMLIGRFLQGVGSGGCFTLGTAIMFDALNEKEAISAINSLNSTIPLVMAAAPMLGAFLNHAYGFFSNFLVIALFVLVSFLICLAWLDETLPIEKRVPFERKKLQGDFSDALTCVPFWQLTLVVSLLFAGYLVFLSGTSILFVLELGVSKTLFPLYQTAILGAWVVASFTANRAMNTWGIPRVKKIGMFLMGVCGVWLCASMLLMPTNPLLLTISMLFYAFGANWTQGLYFAEVMTILPHIKGIAASLLTSTRLLLTAAIVGLVSMFYNATIYPIALVVVAIVGIVLPTISAYEKKSQLKEQKLETDVIIH